MIDVQSEPVASELPCLGDGVFEGSHCGVDLRAGGVAPKAESDGCSRLLAAQPEGLQHVGGLAAAAGRAAAHRQHGTQGPLQLSAIEAFNPEVEVVGQARSGGTIAVYPPQCRQALPQTIAQGLKSLSPRLSICLLYTSPSPRD